MHTATAMFCFPARVDGTTALVLEGRGQTIIASAARRATGFPPLRRHSTRVPDQVGVAVELVQWAVSWLGRRCPRCGRRPAVPEAGGGSTARRHGRGRASFGGITDPLTPAYFFSFSGGCSNRMSVHC